MIENTETYSRMPSTALGTFLRFFDRSSAWLAGDHILMTKRFLWLEQYNRFYLADIQAVTICRTQVSLVWNILLGTGVGLLTLAGTVNGFPPAVMGWLVIFALLLIVNIGLGPTCSCHVYTAVNIHKLPCFNRVSKAMVFLQTVRPLITKVQGEVSDEKIIERAPLIPPLRRTAPGAVTSGPIRHYAGRVHTLLLVLLLSGAILSGLQLVVETEFLGWLTAILFIAQFGMSIAAAARQSGTDIPSALRTVVWLAFGHVLVMVVLFMFAATVWIEMRFSYDESSPTDSVFFTIHMLSMFFSIILCIIGRHLLLTFRNNYRLSRMAATTQRQTFDVQET
jgi:hypothetical protein